MLLLAIASVICAAVPAGLFLRQHASYRAPKPSRGGGPAVSVLIPARNEAANIQSAVESVLDSVGVDLEVVVLDDQSEDHTAEIVRAIASKDPRVRLESAPPLPPGWCGKQHVCATLATLARSPILVFIDADVRLERDGLARMLTFLDQSGAALASGIPRQVTQTFGEKLLIPLIHWVLLCLLPLRRMRQSTSPAYAAGCGQLFICRGDAYHQAGGHGAIRASLHDGIKLPAAFRRGGFATDLFDATPIASCRMYHSTAEVLRGLAKNATEGLAAPSRIVPITVLFMLGQVLPFVLLAVADSLAGRLLALTGIGLAFIPRLLAVRRFDQPLLSALLHPLGVIALLAIQWVAFVRRLVGRPAVWKGRAYRPASVALLILIAAAFNEPVSAGSTNRITSFTLKDQYGSDHHVGFPRTNVACFVLADWKGSDDLEPWIRKVYDGFNGQVSILGVADVAAVPPGLRSMVRSAFVKKLRYPVLLDWNGEVTRLFSPKKDEANIYVVTRGGDVVWRGHDRITERQWAGLSNAVTALLKR